MMSELFHWSCDRSNVLKLARHLINEGELQTALQVYWFFEKPWKWEREWEEMQKAAGVEG